MSSKFAAMPRYAVCAAIVGAMAFGLYGCAKKEAEQQAQTSETVTEEVAASPAMMPAAVGVYSAEVGTGDDAKKVTMMLAEDGSATMMVEYMNGQPSMSQTGTWSMGEMENAINFVYGGEGTTMTMPMMLDGDMLRVGGDMAMAVGAADLALTREAAEAAAEESHEGHNH